MKILSADYISSKSNKYGNRYHAMCLTNLISGESVKFMVDGDNGRTLLYKLFGDDYEAIREFVDETTSEYKIRDFDAWTKDIPNPGCSTDKLVKFVLDCNILPGVFEVAKLIHEEIGQKLKAYKVTLPVPDVPIFQRLKKYSEIVTSETIEHFTCKLELTPVGK